MCRKFMLLSATLSIVALASCNPKTANTAAVPQQKEQAKQMPKSVFENTSQKLDAYWHQGKAELSIYNLEQNRYRDIHPGQAILIFVSEDFLTDKQVKNDNYQNPNSTPILKLNAVSRFTTGLYAYSIMTSVFTPVQTGKHPFTLKVTNSVQDWCGHVYGQINYADGTYKQQLHSYFENEADQDNSISADILEDELMVRLRLAPDAMPTGKVKMVPSLQYLRLRHQPFQAYDAVASMGNYEGDSFEGTNLKTYTVEFPDQQRTLRIIFNAEPPYRIEGWEDTYPSFDNQLRTTRAVRQNTVMEDYWRQNSKEDAVKRDELKIQ